MPLLGWPVLEEILQLSFSLCKFCALRHRKLQLFLLHLWRLRLTLRSLCPSCVYLTLLMPFQASLPLELCVDEVGAPHSSGVRCGSSQQQLLPWVSEELGTPQAPPAVSSKISLSLRQPELPSFPGGRVGMYLSSQWQQRKLLVLSVENPPFTSTTTPCASAVLPLPARLLITHHSALLLEFKGLVYWSAFGTW